MPTHPDDKPNAIINPDDLPDDTSGGIEAEPEDSPGLPGGTAGTGGESIVQDESFER